MLSQGKLFGHPIHMMLIHFPAALLPIAAGYDALAYFNVLQLSHEVLLYLLWPGVTIGWLAVIFGAWDLTRLTPASREMTLALTHGSINTLALCLFSWSLWMATQSSSLTSLHIDADVLAALLMLVGNKFGGDLVLKHLVGVKRSA